MKLGILKTDDVRAEFVEQFGEYPDMFVALLQTVDPQLVFVIYDVQRGQYPEGIDEVDAYLMTGSKSAAYDDEPWIHRLKGFVQQLHQQRKKLVGVCFGHQMIAHSLGGKAEKSVRGWGVGVHTVQMTAAASAAYSVPGQRYRLLVSHQDQVTVPPAGASVLASSDFCPIAMCQVDNHILTFQGHPEFVPEYAKSLLGVRRKNFSDDVYQQAMASLADETDQRLIAQWIVDFISAKRC